MLFVLGEGGGKSSETKFPPVLLTEVQGVLGDMQTQSELEASSSQLVKTNGKVLGSLLEGMMLAVAK